MTTRSGNRVRNRFNHHKRGGVSASFKDAVDIEEAAWGVKYVKARTKRDNKDRREVIKLTEERAKITLPTPEALKKFMED